KGPQEEPAERTADPQVEHAHPTGSLVVPAAGSAHRYDRLHPAEDGGVPNGHCGTYGDTEHGHGCVTEPAQVPHRRLQVVDLGVADGTEPTGTVVSTEVEGQHIPQREHGLGDRPRVGIAVGTGEPVGEHDRRGTRLGPARQHRVDLDTVGGGQPMVGLSGPSTWLVKCIEHRTIVPDRSWASWPGPRMSTWQGVFGGCCSPWATGWLPSPASPSNPCVVVGPSSGTGVERGALTVSTAVSTAVSIVVVDGPGLPMIVGATVTTVVVVLPVPVVVGLVVLIEIVVLVEGL